MDTATPRDLRHPLPQQQAEGRKPSGLARNRRGRAEELLLKISTAVGSNLNLPGILDTILKESMEVVTAQEGSVLLRDGVSNRLEMLASRGLPRDIVRRGHIPRDGSIAQWVVQNEKPLILNGKVRGQDYSPAPAGTRTIASAMCLPLLAKGRVIGTLNLNRTDTSLGTFRRTSLNLMTLVSAHAAESIQIARLHEAVIHAERLAAIGETVSGVAHCVKNMLTGLSGGLYICRGAVERNDMAAFAKGSAILDQAISRISSLAMDMLEYSKDRPLKLAEMSVERLFAELKSVKAVVAEQRDVDIRVAIDKDAAILLAAGDQLFRSLLNLVDNAIDACGRGGWVSLSAAADASPEAMGRLSRDAPYAVVLRVADSGPGIHPDAAGQLFQPFFSTKGSRGTGLGLAVARKIMLEHGGDLVLESQTGQGAVFALYLAAPDPGASSARARAIPPERPEAA